MEAILLGNGAHYYRYYDSLCFQPRIYAVTPYAPGMENRADVIAVCEPFLLTQEVLRWIRNTDREPLVLVEKLPAKTVEETRVLLDRLAPLRTVFVHSRRYTGAPRMLRGNDEILWPNLYSGGMDPVYHTFPNILDFLTQQSGETVTSADLRFSSDGKYPGFTAKLKQGPVTVRIVPSGRQSHVTVNGQALPWPNYFETYSELLRQAFDGRIDREENRSYLLNEMQLVEAFREDYEVWCHEDHGNSPLYHES